MRDAPRIITVEQEGLVCKAMAPECTIPIRTGRRATTRKARKFPRAVAISQRRLGSSSPTASGQGAVGSYEIYRKLPLRLPELTLILRAMSNPLNFMDKNGGRYWTRTSDPCDVNTVLYQLS